MSLWAPEIHYKKGTFWLTYSMPGYDGTGKTSGSGLLRSSTGKPEGPYVDIQPNARLGDEIDATLFEESNGDLYYAWHHGKVLPLSRDGRRVTGPMRTLRTSVDDPDPNHHTSLCEKIFGKNSFNHVGFEGAFLLKRKGLYYLICAEHYQGRYSMMVATSKRRNGPYSARYEAIPHGGHGMLFQDERGDWWATYFGSDGGAPWTEKPGVVPITFDRNGKLMMDDR